jgi:hypothetical protein
MIQFLCALVEGITLNWIIQYKCTALLCPSYLPLLLLNGLRLINITMGGGVAYQVIGAGNHVQHQDNSPQFGSLCSITNFGSTNIVNAHADLTVKFRDYGSTSGNVLSEKTISLLSALSGNDIAPGKDATISIFIQNWSAQYTEVILPKVIELQRVGSEERETVRLIESQLSGFYLSPFQFK